MSDEMISLSLSPSLRAMCCESQQVSNPRVNPITMIPHPLRCPAHCGAPPTAVPRPLMCPATERQMMIKQREEKGKRFGRGEAQLLNTLRVSRRERGKTSNGNDRKGKDVQQAKWMCWDGGLSGFGRLLYMLVLGYNCRPH